MTVMRRGGARRAPHSGHSGRREDAKQREPHAPEVRGGNGANALESLASSGEAHVYAPVAVSCRRCDT